MINDNPINKLVPWRTKADPTPSACDEFNQLVYGYTFPYPYINILTQLLWVRAQLAAIAEETT